MQAETETRSLVHSSLHGIAKNIRITGWITFWVQLTLVVVSGLVLLFASTGRDFTAQPNAGLGIGIFWAICGLLALLFTVYWDFRYTRIGKRLDNPNPSLHPSKAETTRIIQLGIIAGLVGILLSILGAGATLGVLIAKSISQPPGVAITDPNKIIRALDVFVMVANINGITAHFIGTVSSMWLLEKVHQH
jgi:hypothetical protein